MQSHRAIMKFRETFLNSKKKIHSKQLIFYLFKNLILKFPDAEVML